jgi:predicted Ser/Thr protein kinase
VNSERWNLIKELFGKALELDAGHRATFLDEACQDDISLRSEIESLIASHDEAGDFIEKPLYESAPELLDIHPPGESLAGKQLGPYSVIKELGQGGMGVVYLAEDTRLKRLVSMKALAPEFTGDEQHRERLRREARATAALSHPGVATVYSLDEFGGTLFIVGEFVEGESLKSEISRSPQPQSLFFSTAMELAEALAAAHDKNLIHRDLKPENIMRNKDGRIKILDFGLARFQSRDAAALGSASRLTRAGSFLGTPAYASPEQLRGQDAGASSDIFSLGIILYELATGMHPFGGKDTVSTIARILEADPVQVSHINPLSPPALDRIIRRCLSKDPLKRYETARFLVADLESLVRESERHPYQPPAAADEKKPEIQHAPDRSAALWWWQFHQLFVGLAYYLLLYPLWRARDWFPAALGSPFFFGSLVFFASLVAAGIAANLRFHLCFTSKYYPTQIGAQRRRLDPWIRSADLIFALLLTVAAAAIQGIHAFWAALLLAAAVASLIAEIAIEPASANAAFGRN